MNQRWKITLTACLGFCWAWFGSNELLAQRGSRYPEGYIISWQGDTTHGFVKAGNLFKDQSEIVFFDLFGVKILYTADRISGYGYEGHTYISHDRPYLYSGVFSDSVMFLHVIERGPVSLYRFYTRRPAFTFQGKAVYTEFLEMPDGKEYEISLAFRWKKIADIFEDHSSLANAVRSDAYKPDQIPDIVREYNRWYTQRH